MAKKKLSTEDQDKLDNMSRKEEKKFKREDFKRRKKERKKQTPSDKFRKKEEGA